MEDPPPPQRLRCVVQHYEWGRRGATSLVARLAVADQQDTEQHYAELWMGTHPSGPSTLLDDNGELLLLRDWLARKPDALGRVVAARWGGDLPFLFKVRTCCCLHCYILHACWFVIGIVNQVLSVAKALSIQAHPDKKLAEALHALRPSVYKDDSHKPEMAIAITEFRALYGFAGIQVRASLSSPD
jgi:mannose-6-phosphate isomerase